MDNQDFVDPMGGEEKEEAIQDQQVEPQEVQAEPQQEQEEPQQQQNEPGEDGEEVIGADNEQEEAQQDMHEENKQLSYDEFNDLYGDQGFYIDENTYLELDLSVQKNVDFISNFLAHKLPDCYRIDIYNVPLRNQDVNKFLSKCLPSMKIFKFNWNSEISGIRFYADSIMKAASKVSEEVYIYNFSMNQDQLTTIMSSFKHVSNWVCLIECEIITDQEPNFTEVLKDAQSRAISFYDSGLAQRSDWRTHTMRFVNIIKALGKVQDVRTNLREISLHETGLEEDYMRGVLDGAGLDRVEFHQ